MSCTRAIGTNSGLIDNFVSGEIGIVDTKGHIEFGAFIAILGSESCSANSIEQISVSPLSLFIEVINKGNRPNIVVRGIVYGSTLVCTMLITIGITKNALGVRIFGELSGGGGAEVPALAIPRGSARKHFHTDAPMGRRCESAFALLSHKKVTKRLWPAASYGKIGVVGYRLL